MKKNLKAIASAVFLVVAVALLVLAVVRQWDEFAHAVGLIDAPTLVIALVAGVVVQLTAVMASRASLTATSHKIPVGQVARAFLTAALGKYVPGAVWPIVAQMELMRRQGVARVRSALASAITMVLGLGAAVVAGVTGILLGGESIVDYWWLLPVAAACFAVLWPPVLRWGLGIAARLGWRFRTFAEVDVKGRPLAVSTGWALVGALCNGFQTWVILRPLSESGTPSFWLALGAAQLAFAVGFVVVIAPGGIGPREAVLVAFLGPVTGSASGALAVAIVARLVQIVTDCLGALLAVALGRFLRNGAATPVPARSGAAVSGEERLTD